MKAIRIVRTDRQQSGIGHWQHHRRFHLVAMLAKQKAELVGIEASAQRLAAGETPLLDDALPGFERTLIRAALRQAQGGRQEAARLLGWGRNTLTRKLKELAMDE